MGVWKRVRNIKRYYVDSAWQTILPQYEDEISVIKIIEFDNKIYGGTYPNANLLEWSGGAEWVLKADQFSSQTSMRIIEFDSKIYGGTYPNGLLLEWNSTGEIWAMAAGQLDSQLIRSLVVHDGDLYAGTYPDGMLFKFTSGSTEWVMVADNHTTAANVVWLNTLVSYNSKVYGGAFGGDGGVKLLEFNSTGAEWLVVADTNNSDWCTSLAAFDGSLFAGTYPDGTLLEWDGSTTWTQKAGALLDGYHSIGVLIDFDSNLYGFTGYNDTQGAKLLKWNGIDTWVQAADQVNAQRYGNDLVDFNGVLYGCTSDNGQLLKFVDR